MRNRRIVLFLFAALPPLASSVSLIFSPPVLVAVTTAAEANRSAETPIAPDAFFGLAGASGAPLLFGVHDPDNTADFSADGGASWARIAAVLTPPQSDIFVPLYAAAGDRFSVPVAYQDVGSTLTSVTPGGWEQLGITTVRAVPGSNALAVSKNGTARAVFSGVPAPGLNTSAGVDAPRLFGVLRLADSSYLMAATAAFAGVPPRPTPDGPRVPTSLLAFASTDALNWQYRGVIAMSFNWSAFGPNESDLAYAADGTTLVAVIRMDGDSNCAGGSYRSYFRAYSADGGATWTPPAEMPGMGCVRPRLLSMPGGPLVLSGGRNCVANTKDVTVWACATGAPNDLWAEYSISYQHNRLWRGNASFLFDARVNDTTQWETQSYTSLVRTSNSTFLVFYQKWFSPARWPPWPSATFAMQVQLA